MWLFISILSAIVFGIVGWWMKVSQMKGGSVNTLLLGLYIVGTLGFGTHSLIEGSYDQLAMIQVWTAGIVIGIGSAYGNYFFMRALDLGPASLTSPVTNMNIVIVVLIGTFGYHETLSLIQIGSIGLLLLAVILIAQKQKESLTIKSTWWYPLVMIAMLLFAIRNGGLKITDELGFAGAPVLFVSYFVSIFFFLIPVLRDRSSSADSKKIGWRYGLASGLLSYGGLQLYTVALTIGQSNLVAPIFATNGLIVTIGSILIYKEKLNNIQWLAFICLMIGLIMIRL